MPAPVKHLRDIVAQFKQDPESVYNTGSAKARSG